MATATLSPVKAKARIPALDGWRGIAILLVLVDHFFPRDSSSHVLIPQLDWLGQHGVTIFFILSGYLITTKLLDENRTVATLKAFYLRRAFRILPVAFTYLAVTTALGLTRLGELPSCLLFFRNYTLFHHSTTTDHFWTLSIEEQFYIVWPSVLILAGSKRARFIAFLIAPSIAAFRFFFWFHRSSLPWVSILSTEVRADALLIGCIAALMPKRFPLSRSIQSVLCLACIPVFCWCVVTFHELVPIGESVMIGFLIWSTALHPVPVFSPVLNSRWLSWIGIISYSLYIWQEPLRYIVSTSLIVLTVKLLIAFFLAIFSYYLLERPCIRFGRKLVH